MEVKTNNSQPSFAQQHFTEHRPWPCSGQCGEDSQWCRPLGGPCFIGELWKQEGRKVSEGVAFELNRSLKINWSVELEKNDGFGRCTFQKKHLT